MGHISTDRPLTLSVVKEWRDGQMSAEWSSIRQAVLLRDKNTCFYCGFSYDKHMHVHHLHGRFYDDSPENLITVCPLCHACLHIGHSGIKKMGSLLYLYEPVSQSGLNRDLLEGVRKTRSTDIFWDTYHSLPIADDMGSEGLVELANMILSGEECVNNQFLFFPNYSKFDIITALLQENQHRRGFPAGW